jgi:hypothetical protein
VSWPLLLLVLLLLWEKEGSVVHPLLSSCFVVSKRLESQFTIGLLR